MVVRAYVFDVGETLVDETRLWETAAEAAGVPRFTLMAVLGGLIARAEHHSRVWEILDVDPPTTGWESADFYPDALPCLSRLRSRGLLVGAVGNTPQDAEDLLRPHVDVVGSSARWGAEKPAATFFDRVVEMTGLDAPEIAYVGDRVDNDIRPAIAAGMLAVHIRRGPWGHLHEPPSSVVRIRSLDELPEAIASPARG